MSKKVIQGEDIIVLVDEKTTLHATSHSLKVDLEMKDIRTKDTKGKEKSPGDISWSVDGDGLVVIDEDIKNTHTAEEVLGLVLGKTLVKVVVKSPMQGLTKLYEGEAYVTSFSLGTTAGDNATYSYSLSGSGNLTPTTITDGQGEPDPEPELEDNEDYQNYED